jgi:hypothetical protein
MEGVESFCSFALEIIIVQRWSASTFLPKKSAESARPAVCLVRAIPDLDDFKRNWDSDTKFFVDISAGMLWCARKFWSSDHRFAWEDHLRPLQRI